MATETLKSADAVIDALGGTAAVAGMLKCKLNVVSNWRKAGTFPPHSYVAMFEALSHKGMKAPSTLWRMSKPERVSA